MRFILAALLGPTFLMWHHALALPTTPAPMAKVENDMTIPDNSTAVQISDQRLQSRTPLWTSTFQTQLVVSIPDALAASMSLLSNKFGFRLSIVFYPDSGGQNFLTANIFPDGSQTAGQVLACVTGSFNVIASGVTNGNNWAQVGASLAVVWTDSITNTLMAVAWNADFMFNQGDPDLTFMYDMVIPPSGWQQQIPASGTACLPDPDGNEAFTLESYSFLPWSSIIGV